MNEPLCVGVAEAKRQLGGISTATLYRMMVPDGPLDKRKVGHRTVITMASIRAVLNMPAAA